MRPEDRLQSRCAKYLTAALPPHAFFSGIEMARKQSVFSGAVQKAKGVKRGLPDLSIWWSGRYFGVELKVGSSVSDAQRAFGEAMQRNGFRWVVVKSVEALDTFLRAEGLPIAPSMRVAAMDHDAKLAIPEKPRTGTRKPMAEKATASAIRRSHALRQKVIF